MWKTARKNRKRGGRLTPKPKCRFFMQVAGLDGDGGALAAVGALSLCARLPQAYAAEPDSLRVEPRGIRKPFLS